MSFNYNNYNRSACSACILGTLHLTSQASYQASGGFCPGPVNFTCIATNSGAGLVWMVNGSSIATYYFIDGFVYPLGLTVTSALSASGVTVEITSVVQGAGGLSLFRANDVTVLDNTSLQCVEVERSNILNIKSLSGKLQ